MNTRSRANVKRLAHKHIDRYAMHLSRALRGDKGFKSDECADLLKTWLSVLKADFVYENCPPPAQVEIDDAIEACE